MRRHPLFGPGLLFATALIGAACSGSGDDGTPDAGGGSGGAASGGAAATGGGTASGGGTAAGGSATGGSGNAAFECPAGDFAGQVPTLSGKTAALLATSPNMAGDEAQVFLEGPVWADGALYVSQLRKYGDQPPARILKLNGTTLEEFAPDAGTNGLAFDGTQLVAASHKYFGIVTYSLATPSVQDTVIAEYDSDPASNPPDAVGFNSPNDLVIAKNGDIYFTDPSYQCGSNCPQGGSNNRVYRYSGGVVTTVPSTHTQPNGIALSPDESTLYVAGSGPIEKFPLTNGVPGAREVFAGSLSGIDGLAVDCAGNIYATVHSEQNVAVVKPDGTVLADRIAVGVNVTNAAFGGADHKTLYVTTYDKALHSVELDIPGYPY